MEIRPFLPPFALENTPWDVTVKPQGMPWWQRHVTDLFRAWVKSCHSSGLVAIHTVYIYIYMDDMDDYRYPNFVIG